MFVILGYLGALITGVSLGLIGGGGSILIVPVLTGLFEISAETATAYSLFIVGTASLVGAYKYSRSKLINYKTAVIFGLPSLIAVYLTRKYLMPSLPDVISEFGEFVLTKDKLIMFVFASVMLLASVSMIRGRKEDDSDEGVEQSFNYPLILVEGVIVGAVTGFVGAGGGFLIIPALVVLTKLPMHLAIGTSLLIISVKSLVGFVGDLSSGRMIDWNLLLSVTALAIVGIFIGSYLSKFISGKKLKPAFGWFVLVMGIYILGRQLI